MLGLCTTHDIFARCLRFNGQYFVLFMTLEKQPPERVVSEGVNSSACVLNARKLKPRYSPSKRFWIKWAHLYEISSLESWLGGSIIPPQSIFIKCLVSQPLQTLSAGSRLFYMFHFIWNFLDLWIK